MHGEGTLYYTSGASDEGTWVDGKYFVENMDDLNQLDPYLKDNDMYTLDPNWTDPPTNSPTTENQRLTRPLRYVGDSSSITTKLHQCEGSCDKDEECETGLIFFQRKFGGGLFFPISFMIRDSVVVICVYIAH